MTGELYIYRNGNTPPSEPFDASEWLEAYDEWSLSLEKGSLNELMKFRSNKEPVVNKNVTASGAQYVAGAGLVDDRYVNIKLHIVADNWPDYVLKREGFYNAIRGGFITLRIAKPVEVTYRMAYVRCTEYRQFLNGMGKFTLSMYESNGGSDTDSALPEPMPVHKDMEAYLHSLLRKYGGLATEAEVRGIIRNYRYNK